MANPSKAKGRQFENDCAWYMGKKLGCNVERRVMHGINDMGDLYNFGAHGYVGIAECKNHERWSKSDLERWRRETVKERHNANADFALLIIHRKGCGRMRMGESHCHMQVRDLERICGGRFTCLAGEKAKDMWVSMSLDEACRLMRSKDGLDEHE